MIGRLRSGAKVLEVSSRPLESTAAGAREGETLSQVDVAFVTTCEKVEELTSAQSHGNRKRDEETAELKEQDSEGRESEKEEEYGPETQIE